MHTTREEVFSKRLIEEFKKWVIIIIVWSIALYRSETWTLRKYEIHRLEFFEIWTLYNNEM